MLYLGLRAGAAFTNIVAGSGAVCFADRRELVCLDFSTGKERWRTEAVKPEELPWRRDEVKVGSLKIANDVVFAGVSTQIEPIGPLPCLTQHTPVATPRGYVPIGSLKRGDQVFTEDGQIVPVLHCIAYRAPALGSFRSIRLRAPYFGLQQDIIAAPNQRLIMRGSEVEYLFDAEAVLVPARHLVNGFAARYEKVGPLVTHAQVVLPDHQPILAAGTAVESLYLGRLRRKPDALAASVMAHIPKTLLPEHGKPAYPVLRAFEAITLVEQRAA